MVHRNVVTDKFKRQLGELRKWFIKADDADALNVLPYNPWRPPKVHDGLKFRSSQRGTGGYAELVAMLNSIVVGALGWQITVVLWRTVVAQVPRLSGVEKFLAPAAALILALLS
jgi:hypothetical protein